MATTLMGTYYERGLQEGLLQGQRQALQTLLQARFGPLSPTARRWLESLPAEQLNELLLAVLTAQSLQELGLEA